MAAHDLARPLLLYVAFNAPHAPLQAPQEYIDRYKHIKKPERRVYAGMVHCMDDAIGRVVEAFRKRGMLENTLVFFSSDNGGVGYKGGGADNRPLRGAKSGLYEGGIRVPALMVWRGRLKPGAIVNEPLHMVDLYPTLLKLAKARLDQPLPLDGLDIWPTVAEGQPSPHIEILHNVNDRVGAIRRGEWKLIQSRREPGGQEVHELYNIAQDPYEKHNLADQYPEKVQELLTRLESYAKVAVPAKGSRSRTKPADWKPPKVLGEPD